MNFNGSSKNYIYVLLELFRPPSPPIEFQTNKLVRGGTKVVRKRFEDEMLPIPVVIRHPSKKVEELKEELSSWLIHDEPKPLIINDNPNRYYLAFFESMELDEQAHYAKGTINFYLPEAYRFGERKQELITTSEQIYEIQGQNETPWKIEVTFTSNALQYKLESNQLLYVLINYPFVQGDVLVIDYNTRSATLNGNNIDVAISIQTWWELLKPGYIQLKASHASTLIYDERYY